MAAPPDDELDEEEDVPVAAEPADEALELRLDASLLALEEAELATLEALERAELADDPAPEETDEALAPAPFPKMVVEPTVVERVEEPEVSTETMAEVVMADEEPAEPVEEPEEPVDEPDPDPPAPPMPKIVVEPTVVEPIVEPPDVSTEMRADVVTAEEDPALVVSVEVTVPIGLVTLVVAVVVAVPDPPVADAQ